MKLTDVGGKTVKKQLNEQLQGFNRLVIKKLERRILEALQAQVGAEIDIEEIEMHSPKELEMVLKVDIPRLGISLKDTMMDVAEDFGIDLVKRDVEPVRVHVVFKVRN